jgi:hypothetical protein
LAWGEDDRRRKSKDVRGDVRGVRFCLSVIWIGYRDTKDKTWKLFNPTQQKRLKLLESLRLCNLEADAILA